MRCYDCSTHVSQEDQARGLAVMLALEERFADTDYGDGLAETSIDNVHCLPEPDQMDASGNIVYCPSAVLTMIADGLRLEVAP